MLNDSSRLREKPDIFFFALLALRYNLQLLDSEPLAIVLKGYKSLDGYNSFANGWVSDQGSTQELLDTVFICLPRLRGTPRVCTIGIVAGIVDACTHTAALFTAANTQAIQRLTCNHIINSRVYQCVCANI